MTQQITLGDVRRLYEAARGKWTGCDWTYLHGATRIDLDGCTPAQLRIWADRLSAGYYDTDEHDREYERIPRPMSLREWIDGDDDVDDDAAAARRRAAWIDDLRTGADHVARIARSAQEADYQAAAAMRAIRRGDYLEARAAASAAVSCEAEYGDSPTWGAFAEAVQALAGNAGERSEVAQ